jgi:hypothetical protein
LRPEETALVAEVGSTRVGEPGLSSIFPTTDLKRVGEPGLSGICPTADLKRVGEPDTS